MVHRDHAEQVVVVLGDGLAGPVPVDVSGLEVLEVPAEGTFVNGHGSGEATAYHAAVDAALAEEIVDAVRTFVRKSVNPVASDLEHADTYPAELVAAMAEMGLFGCTIPPEYGGLGMDVRTYARVVEELSAGWMSLTGVVNTHTMAATLIRLHGTNEQKERILPRMATGEIRGALSLSEPDAGSDTRNISCRAEPDGDEYVIDGTKMWVTNGERAGLVALAARAPEGITCFLIEKDPGPTFGGISVSRAISKLGYKGL